MNMNVFKENFRAVDPKFEMIKIVDLYRKKKLFVKDTVTGTILNCKAFSSRTIFARMNSKSSILGENIE